MSSLMSSNEIASVEEKLSAEEIQQEYFVANGDVDWNLFKMEERKHLLKMVAIAVCGPPKDIDDVFNANSDDLRGYPNQDVKCIMKVFNKICEQAKYSKDGKRIYVSFLKVLCVEPTKKVPFFKIGNPKNYWVDLHCKKGQDVNIYTFHAFAIRKCISLNSGFGAEKSCRIFIDHEGRLYKNWSSYLKENRLPKTLMVVPTDGKYRGTIVTSENNYVKVNLTVTLTPALGIKARVLSATDTASAAANITSIVGVGVGLVAAPILPVAAPIALGAAGIVGAGSAVYGIVRASINLADLGQHDQSINVTDSEARSNWFNLGLSTAGLSFSVAGRLLKLAASSGMEVNMLINAFNFTKHATIFTGIAGFTNNLAGMINRYVKDGKRPTKMEIVQITTSFLFLTLTVVSTQTAQDIVEDARAKTINDHRNALSSNNKRKIFDKTTAETRRVKGEAQGNTEIIRGLNKIDNKDEFFGEISKINKDLNKNKVKVSMSEDGKAVFNNKYEMSVNELKSLNKIESRTLLEKYGPSQIKIKNAPTRVYSSPTSPSTSSWTTKLVFIRPEEILKITQFLINLSKMDLDYVAEVISNLTADLHEGFLLLCAELASTLCGKVPIQKLVYFIFYSIKNKRPFGECDYENDSTCRILFIEFFQDGRVKKETIKMFAEKIQKWWSSGGRSVSDNPRMFDDLLTSHRSSGLVFEGIVTDELLNIGQFQFRVKKETVEFLKSKGETLPQNKLNIFLKLCYRIISEFTLSEYNGMIRIDPDEDILMRVAQYLLDVKNITDTDLCACFCNSEIINSIAVLNIKENMMKWRRQYKLNNTFCALCTGLCYNV